MLVLWYAWSWKLQTAERIKYVTKCVWYNDRTIPTKPFIYRSREKWPPVDLAYIDTPLNTSAQLPVVAFPRFTTKIWIQLKTRWLCWQNDRHWTIGQRVNVSERYGVMRKVWERFNMLTKEHEQIASQLPGQYRHDQQGMESEITPGTENNTHMMLKSLPFLLHKWASVFVITMFILN